MKKQLRLLFGFCFIASVITFTFFSIDSCKKNPCDNKHCLNGGTCADGTCNCPGGYSGPDCENYDSCWNVTCLNGGTCDHGQCNCLPGYSGSDCSILLPITKLTITKVVVNQFPLTNSYGLSWDSSSGPDLYLTINLGTTPTHNGFVTSYYYTDQTTVPFTYEVDFPFDLTSPTSHYTVSLWDYDDGASDDLIGGLSFRPDEVDSGFPSTIELTATSFDLTLYVTWSW